MQAINTLKDEHQVIQRFLVVLEKLADQVEETGKVDVERFEKILDFIKTFADRCHHGKEEGILFPLVEKRGIPKEEGPIGMMLLEHDQGREYVAGLTEALKKYQEEEDTSNEVAENARGYIEILRNHIPKEDDILYPMAEEVLKPEDDKELIAEFEKVEEEKIGPGKHEEYHQLIDQLEKEVK